MKDDNEINGIRGKYAERYAEGTTVAVADSKAVSRGGTGDRRMERGL